MLDGIGRVLFDHNLFCITRYSRLLVIDERYLNSGVNHSFMPIVIEATSLSSLQLWLILWQYFILCIGLSHVIGVAG